MIVERNLQTSKTVMSSVMKENAHAVLLPAFAGTLLSDAMKRFLSGGGVSLLAGETREEYVFREMSSVRRQEERAETIISLTKEAGSLAGNIIAAVDQEISGICRLHDLVPAFPVKDEIEGMNSESFEAVCREIASAAKAMGINCFLGPVLDIVTGDNPWLKGRTWSTNPGAVAEKSSAYIRGVQGKGVAAAAKHFPGYPDIGLDPAVDSDARNIDPAESFEANFIPFADAVKNGVEIIMTGPAIVEAFDTVNAASISPSVIRALRHDLGFQGIVMSDDLDARAILRGRPVTEVAVDALRAGSDYLLIADIDDHITHIASAIVDAVETGELAEERLEEAAGKVRALARQYSC